MKQIGDSNGNMFYGLLGFMAKATAFIALLFVLKSCFFWLDSAIASETEKSGFVVDKNVIDAHRSMELFSVKGGFSIPFISKVEKSFQVTIQINGKTDNVYVGEYEWDLIQRNDIVDCKYKNGIVTGILYIKNFER